MSTRSSLYKLRGASWVLEIVGEAVLRATMLVLENKLCFDESYGLLLEKW